MTGTFLWPQLSSGTPDLISCLGRGGSRASHVAFVDDCAVQYVSARGQVQVIGGIPLEAEGLKGGELVNGRKHCLFFEGHDGRVGGGRGCDIRGCGFLGWPCACGRCCRYTASSRRIFGMMPRGSLEAGGRTGSKPLMPQRATRQPMRDAPHWCGYARRRHAGRWESGGRGSEDSKYCCETATLRVDMNGKSAAKARAPPCPSPHF